MGFSVMLWHAEKLVPLRYLLKCSDVHIDLNFEYYFHGQSDNRLKSKLQMYKFASEWQCHAWMVQGAYSKGDYAMTFQDQTMH